MMREFLIGNILVRQNTDETGKPILMRRGQKVGGHCHNFGHPTFCLLGTIGLQLLKPKVMHLAGFPSEFDVEREIVISASHPEPWAWVPPMRYHAIVCHSDVARYACVYSHRTPQAIRLTGTPEDWGGARPLLKKDDAGETWMRIDESVVQVSANWPDAYR